MTEATADYAPDVMQVCLNGHVITDRLRTYPDQGLSHCDRCGAATVQRCPTCGQELPGAILIPGLATVGQGRRPDYCSACAAAFPWTPRQASADPANTLGQLEAFLRRVPRAIRQLRYRQGAQPPFRVEDRHDLEDLLRALLALHFDHVRPENRTPLYAPGTVIDFLLVPEGIVICAKLVARPLRERELVDQFQEDVRYYEGRAGCPRLMGFIYDPESLISEPQTLGSTIAKSSADLDVHYVIVG